MHIRIAALLLVVASGAVAAPQWGFYAHREINRYAVYTLPGELAAWYKRNLAYVSAHAVDPDKRRYAAALEGPRHFIDLERFGDGTVAELPTSFWAFHDRYTDLYCLRGPDSLAVTWADDVLHVGRDTAVVWEREYGAFYRAAVLPAHARQADHVDTALASLAPAGHGFGCDALALVDTMTRHGVLPYHLARAQRQLTAAFARGDLARALQLSAELGHYVGDAAVPLHTTENYNGELTGQRGVHSLWESRIPELFAEAEFDPLVGPAAYVTDETALFRGLVEDSHALVDSVLAAETWARAHVEAEAHDCYEERLGRVTRVPCRAFAAAYHRRLGTMVEDRFRAAIRATGSLWYTAWVNGGMPALTGSAVAASPDTSSSIRSAYEGRGH